MLHAQITSLMGNISKSIDSVKSLFTRTMSRKTKPILYGDEASPPCRFALITARVLKMDIEFHMVDLFKGDQKTEFFKTLNPLQQVPVLSMDGVVTIDSSAIALRLCRMSKTNEIYPEDEILRSKIDEMMFFNSGVLFPIDSAIFTEFFSGLAPDEVKVDKWYAALDYLELKLNKNKYLCDEQIRLSDICCGVTVSSLEILVPLLERHQKVKEWLDNLQSFPGFKINNRGLSRLQGFVEAMDIHSS